MLSQNRRIVLIIGVLLVSACGGGGRGAQPYYGNPATWQTMGDAGDAAKTNVELGLEYLQQNQVARAKSKLIHAAKLSPNLPEAHSALAYFYERAGDMRESEREHALAVKLGGKLGAMHNNYATFLCRQGQLQKADMHFRLALEDKSYPHTAAVYENAGVCALGIPDLAKAENYLRHALKQDAKRTQAMLELASLYVGQKKPSDAHKLLTLYESQAEPTAKSLWLHMQVADLQQDSVSRQKYSSQLTTLFQDSPESQTLSKPSSVP